MHAAVSELSGQASGAAGTDASDETIGEHVPAVTPRKSLSSKEHIISLIDGKTYKTLPSSFVDAWSDSAGISPRYRLKPDYPMVAQNYSEQRRAMAVKIGLGSKGRKARTENAAPAAPKPARKPRAKKRQPESIARKNLGRARHRARSSVDRLRRPS